MNASVIEQHLIRSIRKMIDGAPVGIAIGNAIEPAVPESFPIVRIKDVKTALGLVFDPETAFGEGYSKGSITVDGSLLRALAAFYEADNFDTEVHGLHNWLLNLVQKNTLNGSRHNIHNHYDISTGFYEKWLDRELVYTCAYYDSENMTLEAAQQAKMDLICRKLWLRPGEKVIETGCGWGSLALFMARNYGVRVRAFNISPEQIAYARARATREGLASRVEFIEDDYRNVTGVADAFVSIGMLEHIGLQHFEEFGAVIDRTIGRCGRGLLHFIGRNAPRPLSNWIRKRIFPGAYPPSLRESLGVLEPRNLSVLDVENLRSHYARTLLEWLRRYEDCYSSVAEQFGEEFARAWRLYLAGSFTAFKSGSTQLFQMTFAGDSCSTIPQTRRHIYINPNLNEDLCPSGTF